MPGLFEPDPPAPSGFVQVAIERGMDAPEGLTYAVDESLADLGPGDRVIVPLGRGNKAVGGVVLRTDPDSDLPASKIKFVSSRDRTAASLPPDLVDLAHWIATYYACPLGLTLATMFPAAVKKATGLVEKTVVDLAPGIAGADAEALITEHGLRGKQGEALTVALGWATDGRLPAEPKALAEAAGAKTAAPVKALVEKGLLVSDRRPEVRAVWAQHSQADTKVVELNADQTAAVESIGGRLDDGFNPSVLHGVTGSGKTEVYIRLIEQVVAAGRQAIVLVPEIALTPQTAGRFISRFERVAVLHSGLTAAQRHQQWSQIRAGWAQVVVGARSAVFAPVPNLGLVVVDEEHDSSYKQDNAPRYHARDVAVVRAQKVGAAVVLGSATPSLESFQNARQGRYEWVRLPSRVAGRALPKVHIVDMLAEHRETGRRQPILLSRRLEAALSHTLEKGHQAMLLLNRRGFASFLACPSQACGWVKACDHCDVNMVVHRKRGAPGGSLTRCHYCGFENLLPSTCPLCQRKLMMLGQGTQKVEEFIAERFNGVRLTRMDSDTMTTAEHYHKSLDAFGRGETQLLIGTQMIAKGLDFPGVRLVGVISADTALNLPDFRAAERTFQLVCQVAGRSGRGSEGGQVIVQTFSADHPAVQLAAGHDYERFAQEELGLRRSMKLPPCARMVRVVARDLNLDQAQELAAGVARALGEALKSLGMEAQLAGPMPAPIARIGDYHRQQVELIGPDASVIQKALAHARHAGVLRTDGATAVDVDPVNLM